MKRESQGENLNPEFLKSSILLVIEEVDSAMNDVIIYGAMNSKQIDDKFFDASEGFKAKCAAALVLIGKENLLEAASMLTDIQVSGKALATMLKDEKRYITYGKKPNQETAEKPN